MDNLKNYILYCSPLVFIFQTVLCFWSLLASLYSQNYNKWYSTNLVNK